MLAWYEQYAYVLCNMMFSVCSSVSTLRLTVTEKYNRAKIRNLILDKKWMKLHNLGENWGNYDKIQNVCILYSYVILFCVMIMHRHKYQICIYYM